VKTSETKPEFAGSDDDVRSEIPSRPIRDPSLDGLLIGLEERLDQPYSSGAKLRVHTPPNAHTDPFPEEPVVAPNLTAPLSAAVAERVQARGRAKASASAAEPARPPRPQDPTYVLDREPTMTRRAWMVVGACGVVVAGALGVAVWATTRDAESPAASTPLSADPPPAATLPSTPLAALPSAGAASALSVTPTPAPAASIKSVGAHAPPPGKPGQPAARPPTPTPAPGPTVDGRLD